MGFNTGDTGKDRFVPGSLEGDASPTSTLIRSVLIALSIPEKPDSKIPSELVETTLRLDMSKELLAIFKDVVLVGRFIDFLANYHKLIIESFPTHSYVTRAEFKSGVKSALTDYNETNTPLEVTEEELDGFVRLYYV